MATLNAYYQFDIDGLNLNRFIANLKSYLLEENVFDPWEDRFTYYNPDEAIVQHGTDFAYGSGAQRHGAAGVGAPCGRFAPSTRVMRRRRRGWRPRAKKPNHTR